MSNHTSTRTEADISPTTLRSRRIFREHVVILDAPGAFGNRAAAYRLDRLRRRRPSPPEKPGFGILLTSRTSTASQRPPRYRGQKVQRHGAADEICVADALLFAIVTPPSFPIHGHSAYDFRRREIGKALSKVHPNV